MNFDLQSEPLEGALAEIWPNAVIREMPYREIRSVMANAPEDWRAEAIAAACIGVPLDDLLNVPGRYSGAIANLLAIVTRLHGLSDVPTALVNGTEVQTEATSDSPKH